MRAREAIVRGRASQHLAVLLAMLCLLFASSRAWSAQQAQAITFSPIADQFVGATPSNLWASASSGLVVGFASSTPATCAISGARVTPLGNGACTIRASQAGDASFLAAPNVDIAFNVSTVASGALFGVPVNYATGLYPDGMTTGDFNADGKTDLAVVNWSAGTISILLGRGDGTFAPAASYQTGVAPMAVVSADFNGDGKADLAVSNLLSKTVSVLLGNGNGTFTAAASINVGVALFGIAAGDLNGDGKIDLAVTNGTSNGVTGQSVYVLYGNGNGTFQIGGALPTGLNPMAVTLRDVNGDGRQDLLVANADSNTVSVLLSLGNGTFAGAVSYPVSWSPQAIAAGDLNGDGKTDIAVTNSWTNNVSILLNRGDGTFAATVNYPVGTAPGGLVIGDFNGDGKPDVVVLNQLQDNIVVLPGNGNGTFQAALPYGVLAHPLAIASGDFNGDGRSDIAVAASGANAVSVLLRPSSAIVPASLTITAGGVQSAPVNSSYTTPFAVTVRDSSNLVLPGVTVSFTAPSSGASGSFAGNGSVAVTSSALGVATAPTFVANGTTGAFTVTASTGALGATFALTNTAVAGAAPVFTSAPPPSGTAGTPYTYALVASGTPAATFTTSSGTLPSGLSLNGSSGVISGTPTIGGLFNGVITARNGVLPDATQSFAIAISLVAQTISFPALAARTFGAPPFAISATSSSGLPVSFSSPTPTVCTVNAATITVMAAGTCTIRAAQGGNTQYAAAPNVDQSFAVGQSNQTVNFSSIGPLRLNTASVAAVASASSGLPVSFTSQTVTVCSVAADVITMVNVGTCVVRASQAGNANYVAAAPVDQSITVLPAYQTITFWPVKDHALTDSPILLRATVSSGLPVTFTSLTPTVCTVSGASAALIAAGTCSVRATQAGNASFAGITADQSFVVVNGIVLAPAPGVAKGPFVEYATLIGGFGRDKAFDVLVAPDGSAYVGGSIASTNFPGLSSSTVANAGLDLLYVAKVNANRGYLDFVTAVGGRAADITDTGGLSYVASLQSGAALFSGGGQVEAMARDAPGNVYVAAYSTATDFPLRGSTYARTGPKYIFKVTPTGTVQAMSAALDPAIATIRAMTVDSSGAIYFTGVARQGLVTTAGAAIASVPAPGSSFATATAPYLIKLSPGGLSTIFATYLSTPGSRPGSLSAPGQSLVDAATTAYALVTDPLGNSYVAGQATAADFPVSAGSPDSGDLVNRDAFLVKVNATGSQLVFVARLGGSDAERATSIALTPTGDIVMAGKTATQPFNGTPNAFQSVVTLPWQTPVAERETAFVAKLTSDGRRWSWVGTLGTAGGNLVNQAFSSQGDMSPVKVAVDANGAIYVAGTASATRQLFTVDTVTVLTIGWVQVTQDNVQPVANGLGAADLNGSFLLKLAPDGSYVDYAAVLGSGVTTGLAVDGYGNAFVAGYGSASKLVVNAGQATNSFNSDIGSPFIAKINDHMYPLSLTTEVNPATTEQMTNLVAKLADRRHSGTVSFYDGPTVIGSAAITAGVASLPVRLGLGIHRLKATFRGTGPFDGVSSSEVVQIVDQATLVP